MVKQKIDDGASVWTSRSRVSSWRICFSYHVIWSLATRRRLEFVSLDWRQNASSDSIPP